MLSLYFTPLMSNAVNFKDNLSFWNPPKHKLGLRPLDRFQSQTMWKLNDSKPQPNTVAIQIPET
jgi:hypothetical protein